MEKPPSTPEMSAREEEDMADAMLRNSPLPDAERSDERFPEGSGSDKLPEEGGNEKLPEEEGGEKLPEETPTGKLIMPCTEKILFLFLLVWLNNHFSFRFPKSREYYGEDQRCAGKGNL